jgi:hypothetical protein
MRFFSVSGARTGLNLGEQEQSQRMRVACEALTAGPLLNRRLWVRLKCGHPLPAFDHHAQITPAPQCLRHLQRRRGPEVDRPDLRPPGLAAELVWCCMLDGTKKLMVFCLGKGVKRSNSSTIARLYNASLGKNEVSARLTCTQVTSALKKAVLSTG